MQLLGRRLGIMVAAWLLAACPRYAVQPPPRYATDPSGESAGVTLATNAKKPDKPARPAGNPTCISGTIMTGGAVEIPIARARVTVALRDLHTGEALTDDNGRFNWCAPRVVDGTTVRATVRVEKAAFATSDREIDIPVGSTTELAIGLNPTS